MEKPRIYLSGPVSGHMEEMKPVFSHIKSRLSSLFYVFSPMDEIPSSWDWERSMKECERRLKEEKWDMMIVVWKKDWTEKSRGVKKEVEWARELNIPVHNYFADLEL